MTETSSGGNEAQQAYKQRVFEATGKTQVETVEDFRAVFDSILGDAFLSAEAMPPERSAEALAKIEGVLGDFVGRLTEIASRNDTV